MKVLTPRLLYFVREKNFMSFLKWLIILTYCYGELFHLGFIGLTKADDHFSYCTLVTTLRRGNASRDAFGVLLIPAKRPICVPTQSVGTR